MGILKIFLSFHLLGWSRRLGNKEPALSNEVIGESMELLKGVGGFKISYFYLGVNLE